MDFARKESFCAAANAEGGAILSGGKKKGRKKGQEASNARRETFFPTTSMAIIGDPST